MIIAHGHIYRTAWFGDNQRPTAIARDQEIRIILLLLEIICSTVPSSQTSSRSTRSTSASQWESVVPPDTAANSGVAIVIGAATTSVGVRAVATIKIDTGEVVTGTDTVIT